VKKTPSTLKWLAEKRARLAGDLQRLDRLALEIAARKEALRQELASLDAVIKMFDSRLDPGRIPAVAAHKNRYGKYGGLIDTARKALKAAAPDSLTTTDLALYVSATLGIEFATPTEQIKWQHNSLGRALKNLVVMDEIERLHDPVIFTTEVGRWRWKPVNAVSLDELRTQADSAGVGTQEHVSTDERFTSQQALPE